MGGIAVLPKEEHSSCGSHLEVDIFISEVVNDVMMLVVTYTDMYI